MGPILGIRRVAGPPDLGLLFMGRIVPQSGGSTIQSAYDARHQTGPKRRRVGNTYVEIRASSMVPEDNFESHDICQQLRAHSLVGVAFGRGGNEREREKKEVLMINVAMEQCVLIPTRMPY
jgi:hypothetical protein